MNAPMEPAFSPAAIQILSAKKPKARLTYVLTLSTLGREAVIRAAPSPVIAALPILGQLTMRIIINAMRASVSTLAA